MEQRLTKAQLERIVAEVQKLSDRRESELNATEVREILQELNLPPELLDEAMVQLSRSDALVAQQRRNRWLIGGAAGVGALVLSGILFFTQYRQDTLSRVTAGRDRLTLTQDRGDNLSSISRQAGEQVFYRITLADAPVGEKLSLSCKWIDPNGQIVHENQYQTKEITKSNWDTFCRHTIGAGDAIGQWRVESFLGDRRLSDATFDVK